MEENQKSNAGQIVLKVFKALLKVIYVVITLAVAAAGIIAIYALIKTGFEVWNNLDSIFMLLK